LTIQHNSNLLAAIHDLGNELDPGVKLISLDIYSRFNEILSNPNQFGLQNVTQPCITEQSCLFDPNIQNQYVFWDGTHPTTAVHQLIGQFAFETLKAEKARSIPEPSAMLGILTVGAMGAMGMIKGQKRKSKLNLTSPIAEAQSFHSMVES
jgi:phospholipase/lecithinase/hemolysin